jgi:hypothetical protein
VDPTRHNDQDATQPVRPRRTIGDRATPTPEALAAANRSGSGVRVWPPKPKPSSGLTVSDFDIDAESVKEEPATPAIIEAILVEHLCPICEVKLIDPDGIGICPKCGLCRSLKEGCEKLAEAETAERKVAKRKLPPAPKPPRFPSWIWGLFGGCLLIMGTAIIAGLSFPHQCRERTVWSTYQLIIGLGTVLIAQWWVILKLEPDLGRLGIMELFVISGRLWNCAFQRMPYTLGPVYLGCWGLLIAITAVTITGGLADWFSSR